MEALRIRTCATALGPLTLVGSDRGLREVRWGPADGEAEASRDRVLDETERQLHAYFDRRLKAFELPLDLAGTEFQLAAWRSLANIPYGTTTTYADQALRLGRPGAARAVGSANGRNPLPIVLPCHRLVGADGSLVGYGGGLDRKRFLLEHEARSRSRALLGG